ncbi:MAG: hypothetical protein IIV03_01910 [Clostridia bacterium]|nr:hypothetical protein [Clostridia bacterium]
MNKGVKLLLAVAVLGVLIAAWFGVRSIPQGTEALDENGDDLRGGALHIADTEITLGQRHFQRDGLQVQKTVG